MDIQRTVESTWTGCHRETNTTSSQLFCFCPPSVFVLFSWFKRSTAPPTNNTHTRTLFKKRLTKTAHRRGWVRTAKRGIVQIRLRKNINNKKELKRHTHKSALITVCFLLSFWMNSDKITGPRSLSLVLKRLFLYVSIKTHRKMFTLNRFHVTDREETGTKKKNEL